MPVVDANVPRWIAPGPPLELGPIVEREGEVDARLPQRLRRHPCGVVAGCRLRLRRQEPPRKVRQRGHERDSGPARRRGARLRHQVGGHGRVGRRVGDVHDLELRVWSQQRLERVGGVESGVPRGDTPGEYAAKSDGAGETVGVRLHEAGRDDAAKRQADRDDTLRLAHVLREVVEQPHPVELYVEAASAYPPASSHWPVRGSGNADEGFVLPGAAYPWL